MNNKIGNRKIFLVILIIFSFLFANLPTVLAVTEYESNPDFTPNYLISDESMTDAGSLNIEQIRDFAANQGGTLDTYVDPETSMPAYWVIWQAAQEFQISPKFLLTLLQKEQSLVNDDDPSENQYNWATGYSCYGGICLDIYKGFSRQVRAAAKKFRDYFNDLNIIGKYKSNFNCTFTKWCVGMPKMTQDQIEIMPQTKATAALYTYNPYRGNTVMEGYKIGANYNFWKIWRRWFETNIFRPNGTLVKTSAAATVYLIKDNQKLPFANFSALVSRYDPKNIMIVDQKELDNYPLGAEIKFPQYSLLKNQSGSTFLLVDEKLKKISSSEVFRTLGFNPEEVIDVQDSEIATIPLGAEITMSSSYPTGALVKDQASGGVYFVQSGIKYPILSQEILKYNYGDRQVLTLPAAELEAYPKADPVRFKDGALVKAKNDDKVYIISDGKKMHIKDESSFISRGYLWTSVIETNEAALNIHSSGQILESLSVATPPLDIEDGEVNDLPQT